MENHLQGVVAIAAMDADIYRRFLKGDAVAAEEMLDLYGRGLTLFLYGLVGNMDDAEELMVEAFARVMVKARPIRDEGGLKAYLFTTGRNLALRLLKKHRRERHLSLDDLGEQPDTTDTHSPEAAYLREEKSRQLYASMQALKQDHREALYLLYLEDMSYAEAGRVLGKTPKQMDNLVQYAKQKLKEALRREGVSGYED